MQDRDGPFYLIIGLGFSAILNHTLLRRTPAGIARLNGLPILHVGLPDPWGIYDIDSMGQWPSLLCLPKFGDQHKPEAPDRFLSPVAFARATTNELKALENDFHNDSTEPGLVQKIVQKGGRFEVSLIGPRTSIIADKIDVCTGPGISKKLTPEKVEGDDLRREYLDGPTGPGPRRLISGEEFLNRNTLIPPASEICVCGGGIGAWCVERALKSKSIRRVVWVSRELSDGAFPPSKRNDDLVSGLVRDGRNVRPEKIVRPNDPLLTIALAYEVEKVTSAANGKLEVRFSKYAGPTPRSHLDHLGQDLGELDPQLFDQVVIAIGQEIREPMFLEELTEPGMPELHPIFRYPDEKSRRTAAETNVIVGFCDHPDPQQSRIRILGPAARALPDRLFLDQKWKLNEYEKTLARQAHGSQIPSGALAVAWANGFFGRGNPNRNINTADSDELMQLGMPEAEADGFVEQRKDRTEPFNELPPELDGRNLDYQY